MKNNCKRLIFTSIIACSMLLLTNCKPSYVWTCGINSEISFGKGYGKHYKSLYDDVEDECFYWMYRYEYPDKNKDVITEFTFSLQASNDVSNKYHINDFAMTIDGDVISFEDDENSSDQKDKYEFKGEASVVISYKEGSTAMKNLIKSGEYYIDCAGNEWAGIHDYE